MDNELNPWNESKSTVLNKVPLEYMMWRLGRFILAYLIPSLFVSLDDSLEEEKAMEVPLANGFPQLQRKHCRI